MSKVITGVVEFLNEKEFGGRKLYSIKVEGEYYGCGNKRPACSKGDSVKFNAVQNGKYWNVDGNVDVQTGSAAAATAAASPGRMMEERKQKAIALQAARNSAIAVTSALLQSGAIKLPSTQAKQADVVLGFISDLAAEYLEETMAIYEGKEAVTSSKKPSEDASSDNMDDDLPF